MYNDFLGNELKLNDKVVLIQNNEFNTGIITNVGIDVNKKEYIIILIDSKKTISQKRFTNEVINITHMI